MAFNPLTQLEDPNYVPPAAAVPQAMPLPMAVPAQIDTFGKVGPSSTTHEATPEAKAAYAGQQAEFAKRQEAADKEQAIKQQQAAKEAEFAQKQADLAAQQEAKRVAAQQAAEVEIAKRTAYEGQKRDEMEKAAHPTTYWEDKSTPSKILAAFVVGLSSAAGGNAYQIYKDKEAADRQHKIDIFTRSKEFHELAKDDVDAARSALTNKLHDITNEELVNSKLLEKQLGAVTKRIGTPMAQAAYEKEQAAFRAGEQEKLSAQQAHYAKSIESGHKSETHTTNSNGPGSATGPKDTTALDANGNPYGQWRTLPEAEKGRDQQSALVGFRGAIQELNQHLAQKGRLFNPTSDAYAERQALIGNASRFLQKLNDAGVLNPGEYERNIKTLGSSLLKSGDNAAKANDLMIHSAERTYDAALKGKAIRGVSDAPQAAPDGAPAAPRPHGKSSAVPAGAKLGTLNGVRGYALGGKFHPLGADQ